MKYRHLPVKNYKMDIKITNTENLKIAELSNSEFRLNDIEDITDLLGNSFYLDANCIMLSEDNLPASFFELKTRVAGEVLQKFSNYNQRLAIVGDFSKYESKSLRDFIFESNKTGRILFAGTREEAIERWSKKK